LYLNLETKFVMAPEVETDFPRSDHSHGEDDIKSDKKRVYVWNIVWRNVILLGLFHLGAVYGCYLLLSGQVMWKTALFAYVVHIVAGFGGSGGAHRLWSHRAFKATWQLRSILAFCNSVLYMTDIYEWSRDHRVHHKYAETDADPYNAKRGFFFSHVGWLLIRKLPDVTEKGKTIDCSDILADPIVKFQRKFYLPLVALCCFTLPTVIPNYLWGESHWNAFFVCGLVRYVYTLHSVWFVNSAAHLWGPRPYDKNINPAENLIANLGTLGEGFHNFHHSFPYDYAASEYGQYFNLTATFIDWFAKIGWAYDLRTAPKEAVEALREKHGDHRKTKLFYWF